MYTGNMKESIPSYPDQDRRKDEEKKSKRGISRRALLFGAATAGVAAVTPKFLKWYEEHEASELQESIDREKKLISEDIDAGIESVEIFDSLLREYNDLVAELKALDEGSKRHLEIKEKLRPLDRKISRMYVRRGGFRIGPMPEATPFAESIKENPRAIEALALVRAMFADATDTFLKSPRKFPYWHNCAKAYLELGKQSDEEIKSKLGQLFEYCDENDIDIARVAFEQILYCLIDESFDFSLTAKKMESAITAHVPGWKENRPTHADKDNYRHYNDLSAFSVFELNRMNAVLAQLKDDAFVSDLFTIRDLDVKNDKTELGGVIPIPEKGDRLRHIPAKREDYNSSYVTPNQEVIDMFSGASTYHFHTTSVETPEEYQGPSGGDHGFFTTGVVFSSVNQKTIRAHFYASRYNFVAKKDRSTNDVVFLGDVNR
jgi:hypothetical protein